MHPYVPNFDSIFEGNRSAYGRYTYPKHNHTEGKKVKGKGSTIKKDLKISDWEDHITGKTHLGIVPINNDSEVKFGVIDVDNYDISHDQICRKIQKHELPLVLFRSKSGGAHLYLFVSEFIPASLMQKKLREMASLLGWGSSEIFPKQGEIKADRGDVGNWINMPYFNGDESLQYAFDDQARKLDMKGFISLYPNKVVNQEYLLKFNIELGAEFSDGPPCLQHLNNIGLVKGTRNNAIINFGIYFKKKYPDDWQRYLEEYNAKLPEPLPPKEILDTIKSLRTKDYQYTCKTEPICSHCNSKLCRTRQYGIDVGSGFPVMGTLTKLETDPPLWFLDIEDGGRLELTTDELQSQFKFQKRCMETLNTMPVMPEKTVWQQLIATLLRDLVVIEVPEESTPKGQLFQHLEEFCVRRPSDDNPEAILRGLIYNTNFHHHFRLSDFLIYLKRKDFKHFTQNRIVSLLKEFGCEYKTVNVKKGLSRKCYRVSFFYEKRIEFEEPEIEGESDIPY